MANNRIFCETDAEFYAAMEELGFKHVHDDNASSAYYKDLLYFKPDEDEEVALSVYTNGSTRTLYFLGRYDTSRGSYTSANYIVSTTTKWLIEYFKLTNGGLLLKFMSATSSAIPVNTVTNYAVFGSREGDDIKYRYLFRTSGGSVLYEENVTDAAAPVIINSTYMHTPLNVTTDAFGITKAFMYTRYLDADVYNAIINPSMNNNYNYIFTIDGEKYVWGLGPDGVQQSPTHKMYVFKLDPEFDI